MLKWPGINPVALNVVALQQAHGNLYPVSIDAHPINSEAAHQEFGQINKHLEAIQEFILYILFQLKFQF